MSQTLNAPPVRLGAFRQGAEETRGLDLTDYLAPVGDTIATITSITVARRDGTGGTGDLSITPSGTQPPWITAVPYGQPFTPGLVINWWQTAGATVANAGDIDYKITITALTTGGRDLVRDCYQLVVSGLG